MTRETKILVDADIVIRYRETGEEENLIVRGISTTWHWDDESRDAAEYWAVADWVSQTFGNNVDWFSITSWTGTPEKDKLS